MSKRSRATVIDLVSETMEAVPRIDLEPEPRLLLSYGVSADTWTMILSFLPSWNDKLSMRLVSRDSYHWTTEYIKELVRSRDQFHCPFVPTFEACLNHHFAARLGHVACMIVSLKRKIEQQRHRLKGYDAKYEKVEDCVSSSFQSASKRHRRAVADHLRAGIALNIEKIRRKTKSLSLELKEWQAEQRWLMDHRTHYNYKF